MKFGVFSQMQWPQDRSQSEVFREELEQLTIAEAQGYDSAWLGEQHCSRYGIAASIHLNAANLAARTTRIRIGTAVTMLPFFHPLRVAEEVAMLDIMSGGRIDWGVGCAHPGQKPVGSELDDDQRRRVFREQLGVVKQAWKGEPFAHEGEFFQFPTLECHPTPEQTPHPPIYIADDSPESLEWAGGAGYPVLADSLSSIESLERNRARYRESAERAGVDVSGLRQPTLRQVYCGENMSRAREEAAPALLACSLSREPDGAPDSEEALLDYLFESCAIVGDEGYCRDKVAELEERIGLDTLLCWQSFGNLPHEACMASQRRWIEQVVPAFR